MNQYKGPFASKAIFAFGCCTILASCNRQTGPVKPNILFIMSDDHAFQAISAYNNSLIQTPNIDRIARDGILFQNAFVTNSLSAPSRAVILTGKYSNKNGFRSNGDIFNGEQPTLPKILKQNGYATAIIGKWHLNTDPTGFDFWDILPGQGHYYNPDFIKMGRDTVYKGYVTDIIADNTIEWIRRNSSGPFFIMMHNKAPHRNWMPPLNYLDEFNNVKFSLPVNFNDNYAGRMALQRQSLRIADQLSVTYDSKVPCDTCQEDPVNSNWTPGEWEMEFGRLTAEEKAIWEEKMKCEYEEFATIKSKDERVKWQFRRYLEDYLRCIKSVDDNVGKVIQFLKKSGLDKNTIVIYTSDQGFFLGEHGLYDKRFMYEESFRTPLMIYSPFSSARGTKNSSLVMNLDIAPTLLDYAGIRIPEDMQGSSLKPFVEGQKVADWRNEIYYHYYEKAFGLTAHYGLRTNRYKLIRFYDPIDGWELYDLKTDSLEMNNVYDDPAYAGVRTDLMQRIEKAREKYGDNDQPGL